MGSTSRFAHAYTTAPAGAYNEDRHSHPRMKAFVTLCEKNVTKPLRKTFLAIVYLVDPLGNGIVSVVLLEAHGLEPLDPRVQGGKLRHGIVDSGNG